MKLISAVRLLIGIAEHAVMQYKQRTESKHATTVASSLQANYTD
jgi:hypothetical protein